MKRTTFTPLAALLLLTILSPGLGRGADLDLRSSTYLHLYQVDQPIGPDAQYAPLYEYLSLDLWEVGRPELSLHLNGWGRLDLGDESGSDTGTGYLSSGHLRYRSASGQGRLSLGRMLVSEGTSLEAIDGLHVWESLGRAGIALFGGRPNSSEASQDLRGDTLVGARTFFLLPGRMEIGLNYLQEDGDFDGEERQEAGTDLWLQPTDSLQVTGRALYNISTSGLASDSIALNFSVTPNLDLTLASAGYSYRDLFQAVTNPAFLSTVLNPDDEVRILRGDIHWNPASGLGVTATVQSTDHSQDDPGDTSRSQLAMEFIKPLIFDRIGVQAADQKGDLTENEYTEWRAYCMASVGNLRLSLDALTMNYTEEIDGEDQTIQVVGSVGMNLFDKVDLSSDVRLTRSPVFDEDVAVFLRARYNLGSGSGAY